MTDFAAIDFGTANGQRSSVCSVGVVVVRGGVITETQNFASLHPSTSQVVPKYFASPSKPFDLGRVCLHYACTMGRTWVYLWNVGAGRVLGLGR